tara:strand:+ start:6099 stop:6326 length:228 start_codon:yes stop_codon:yes gene_type:complete
VNKKLPNNKYPLNKKKSQKRASLDHGICEICEEEFRASYNLDQDLICELIWVQLEGKMVLACDECKQKVNRNCHT